jgi:hypothetical protein
MKGCNEEPTLLRRRQGFNILGRKARILVLFAGGLPSVRKVIALRTLHNQGTVLAAWEDRETYLLREGLVVLDIDWKIMSRSMKPLLRR